MCLELNAATDFFGMTKMSFDGESYNLSWSANSHSNVYIEDFLPKGEAMNHFEKKVSVTLVKGADCETIFRKKLDDIAVAFAEKQIDKYDVDTTDMNDVVIHVLSRLEQGETMYVVQSCVYRVVKNNDDVVLFEAIQRSYKDFQPFLKKEDSLAEKMKKSIRLLNKNILVK